MAFTVAPDGAFSLAAAAAFGFGPNTGRPKPAEDGMRLAFVTDDMSHQAGVHLTQDAAGTVIGTAETDGDPRAVEQQVCRILSLDHAGSAWAGVGERDPVIGGLQQAHPGLRPVLFHSPYEAAAWSVLSARRRRAQAAALRTRISADLGRTFSVAGERVHAFPLPERLLTAPSILGVDEVRLGRLRAVARAALDGALDPRLLAGMEPGQALEHIQRLPGIGPMYATLVLLRATGVTDVMTYQEPRLPSYVAHFYATGSQPVARGDLERVCDQWRPFRTWTSVLIRVAGDRLGLPWE